MLASYPKHTGAQLWPPGMFWLLTSPSVHQLCRFAFLGLQMFPWDPLFFFNQHAKGMRNRELKKCILCPCVSIDLSGTAVWKKDCSSYSKHCFILGHWSKP